MMDKTKNNTQEKVLLSFFLIILFSAKLYCYDADCETDTETNNKNQFIIKQRSLKKTPNQWPKTPPLLKKIFAEDTDNIHTDENQQDRRIIPKYTMLTLLILAWIGYSHIFSQHTSFPSNPIAVTKEHEKP